MHLKVKKKILHIFTHVPGQDFLRFLSSPPKQSEISHSPEGSIFWKIYPPQEKVWGNCEYYLQQTFSL